MFIENIAQLLYLLLSVSLAVWVGENLHRNGRIFVIDAFGGDEMRGDAVNQLLRVGFYLVNVGFIMIFLTWSAYPTSAAGIVPYLATKIGLVSVVLGGMHYFNMRNLAKMRSNARRSFVANAPHDSGVNDFRASPPIANQ